MRCPCRNCLLIPICRERTKKLSALYTIRHCDLCKKYLKRKSKYKERTYTKAETIRYFLLTKKPSKKKRKKY
jgi:hypothetical protein